MKYFQPDTAYFIVEESEAFAATANKIVKYAGIDDRVLIYEGTLKSVSLELFSHTVATKFDYVIMRQAPDLYIQDIKLLHEQGKLGVGSKLIADNTRNTPDYVTWIQSERAFHSETVIVPFEHIPSIADALEISTLVS